MRQRTGFHLTELLIAIAMLAMIIALILPAIQQAADVSRMTKCRNNLQRIAMAMHNYHEAYKQFPPGIIGTEVPGVSRCIYNVRKQDVPEAPFGCKNPRFANASGLAMILPYLEQRAVHNSYNFSLACCSAANSTSTTQVIGGYVCPTNERGMDKILRAYYVAADAGPTDYGLNLGSNALLTCATPFARTSVKSGYPRAFRQGAGPFNVNFGATQKHFRDGMANTYLVGEISGGAQLRIAKPLTFDHASVSGEDIIDPALSIDQAWSQGFIGNDYAGGSGSVFAATAFDQWFGPNGRRTREVGPSPGYTPLKLNMAKLRWMRRTSYAVSLPNGLKVADEKGKPVEFSSQLFSMSPFRSYHPGAAQFAMADGSVQVVNENIDPSLYTANSTFYGSEVFENEPLPD